jgi:hypothetical protein
VAATTVPGASNDLEPIILLDDDQCGSPRSGAQTAESRLGQIRRRVRRYGPGSGLLIALVMVAAVGVVVGRPDATGASAVIPGAGVPNLPPPLLMIATDRPGDVVALVAYRRGGLCGDISVLLDGLPLDIRLLVDVGSADPLWQGVQLTFQIPPTTPAGPHEVELLANSSRPGRGEIICFEQGRHSRIATATIVVSEARTGFLP